MTTILCEQIASLRKARGLTQEQLGRLLGVSAQAVSKWEKGGTPDVELLPSLAEQLGVTIDTLFGRSEQELEDMPKRLTRWLETYPMKERMLTLFRLLAKTFPAFVQFDLGSMPDLPNESCYLKGLRDTDGGDTWVRSMSVLDSGLVLGILSENFPLYLLLPKPPEGYERHFAENDDYRRLFAVLSMPCSLEILRYLYSQKEGYYTPAAVAKRVGLPLAGVQDAMEAMEGCHLLNKTFLEVEEGSLPAYVIHDTKALVPFLYFARWFMEQDNAWFYGWEIRTDPILMQKEEGARK